VESNIKIKKKKKPLSGVKDKTKHLSN